MVHKNNMCINLRQTSKDKQRESVCRQEIAYTLQIVSCLDQHYLLKEIWVALPG